VRARAGSPLGGFADNPTIFCFIDSDAALIACAWAGTALALVVLAGFANSILMAVLWAMYMSFVHVGQEWYAFGWEIQLLETGFLAIFLCPLLDARPFPRRAPAPIVLGLFRWLIFRIMLGAGLIKLRGDPCWRNLTCLDFHYETQPIPNPLSRTLHFMPHWFQAGGVLFNHLCELVAPWFAFWPRRGRLVAGVLFVSFQATLILSGNLSFLNWLTIVPALACFDDGFLRRLVPRALASRAERAAAAAIPPSRAQRVVIAALAGTVAALSYAPVRNLLSPRQAMNASFGRRELVNTYGAFGSVGRERPEIVLEGTEDAVDTPGTVWRAYEFRCKPGDPMRRPCVVSPYHERLDWLMWFAAMSSPERYPWSIHLVWKLLHNDALALSLLANDPFPASPPKRIRGLLYRYEFAPAGDPEGRWWKRTRIGTWLPPLSADDERLRRFLEAHGWASADPPPTSR